MKQFVRNPYWIAAILVATCATGALAQGGYGYPPAGNSQGDADQGPVRLARFSFLKGDVVWRASDQDDWSDASWNLPIREGAQIWAPAGFAEIQFDDGSVVRLTDKAFLTLDTLYSDSQGEYSDIRMTQGVVIMRLRCPESTFQVDTPYASIQSAGTSNIRIEVGDRAIVYDRGGTATVQTNTATVSMPEGTSVDVNETSSSGLRNLPRRDGYDRWSEQLDQQEADSDSAQYLPANIALVAGNLNASGTWYNDPQYGWSWAPTVTGAGWRPYMNGHWVWVSPFGWTWVSDETWGWAPYHYGTWISGSHGWAWVPGPAQQYWSPAVVHFVSHGATVAWAPLAPEEVQYPAAVTVSFGGSDWTALFSIGGAAIYSPSDNNVCTPHPWVNRDINRAPHDSQSTILSNASINNAPIVDNHFIPRNAKMGATITASTDTFGGSGKYHAQKDATIFAHGQTSEAPQSGAAPVFNPVNVQPTRLAFTASRTVAAPRTLPAAVTRKVIRTPPPAKVQQARPQNGNSNWNH